MIREAPRLKQLRREAAEKAQRESVRDPLTGEVMEIGEFKKTLPEVMQNKEDQGRFFQFLGAQSESTAKEVIEAFAAEKELTPSQHNFVMKSLDGYNLRRAEMEKLKTTFDSTYVESIAEGNADIRRMIDQIGSDKAHSLLLRKLENLSVEKPKEFAAIVQAMRSDKDLVEGPLVRGANHRFAENLKRVGIDEGELLTHAKDSMHGTNASFSTTDLQAVEKQAREKMGIFMSLADTITRGGISHRRAKALMGAFAEQRDISRDIDTNLANIGKHLFASVTPEEKQQMRKVMFEGGFVEERPKTNVNTFTEYKPLHEQFSDEEREKRHRTYLKSELKKLKKKPEAVTQQDVDRINDSWVSGEIAEQAKYKPRGIFSALLALVFKSSDTLKKEAYSRTRLPS